PRVSDDTHNLGIGLRNSEALSTHTTVVKISPDRRFVDDRDTRRTVRIADVEIAALEQADAHRLEVFRTDEICLQRNLLARPPRVPRDLESVTYRAALADEAAHGDRSRAHAGHSLHP